MRTLLAVAGFPLATVLLAVPRPPTLSLAAFDLKPLTQPDRRLWRRVFPEDLPVAGFVFNVLLIARANTTGLMVVTLFPRYATEVLSINTENAIFVVTPAAAGIWLALRFVGRISGSVSPWWSVGGSYAALVVGVMLLAFIRPMGRTLEDWNLVGAFDPGPFGEGTARIIITGVLAAGLAFAFTFVNVVGRSIVNRRIPREMQGRVFAAQTVLTNLASIPPILLTGLLADAIGVTPVFFFVGLMCGVLAIFYAARNLAMPARTAY